MRYWTFAGSSLIAALLICCFSLEALGQCPPAGALTFLRAHQQGIDQVTGVTVSPDGLHVYTVSPFTHTLTVFSRNADTAELSFVQSISDGEGGADALLGATSFKVSPDGEHAYVVSQTEDAITVFSRNQTSGELTFVQSVFDDVGDVVGLNETQSLAISPDGAHVYATGRTDDSISAFFRDPVTGELAIFQTLQDNVDGVDGLDAAATVVLSPDGANVYVVSKNENAVSVFSRDSISGELTFSQVVRSGVDGVAGLDAPTFVAIPSDGNHVYVGGLCDSTVALFSRDPVTGELTFLESIIVGENDPFICEGPGGAAISSDGASVYVTVFSGDLLLNYSRNPSTGSLELLEVFQEGLDGVDGLLGSVQVTVSPDDEHVYVAGKDDNAIATFLRLGSSGSVGVDVFVSPDGDNQNLGTEASPWQDINFALTRLSGTPENPSTIHLEPGVYEEEVILCAYVSLVGEDPETTILQFFDPGSTDRFVLEAGEGSEVIGIQLRTPQATTQAVDLLRVRNVSAFVEDVTFDGRDNPLSFGVFASGVGSSGTLVQNCLFRRVGFAVQAVETEAEFRNNIFRDIRADAVFVSEPLGKNAAQQTDEVPLFGDETIEGTGGNVFDNVGGQFIINNTETTVKAEKNSWGLADATAIGEKMTGPVDFEPFVAPGQLAGTVTDATTGDPIAGATVTIEELSLSVTTLNDGTYAFVSVPAGSITVRVERAGYRSATVDVTVATGGITTQDFSLTPGADDGNGVSQGCPSVTFARDTAMMSFLKPLRQLRDGLLRNSPVAEQMKRTYYSR